MNRIGNNILKEKAIKYALATLAFDGLDINPDFVNDYKIKNNIPIQKDKTRSLVKGDKNAKRK